MELINTGGRPQKTLDKNQLMELELLAGTLSKAQVAEYFGMTEKTLRAIEERQPEVFTAYRKGKAQTVAKVTSALMKAVNRGDMRAIQFYLKTQAGWTEKSHIELSKAEEPSDNHMTVEFVGVDDD